MKKLAIISSHPIQYNAPVFKLLSQRNIIDVKVFYTWGKAALKNKFDPGFGKTIEWDIPLLEGYEHEFLENVSAQPGSHHFKGINNPNIVKAIDAYKPNAIMVYGWSFKSHLKVLRHFKNKATIIFRGDSTLLDETKNTTLKKVLRKFFLKWVYKHIDFALYCGKSNKEYFEKYGLQKNELVFAPHTIDAARFQVNNDYKNFREELNISANDFVFVFIGKFEPKKNPLLLVDAFLELNKPQTHLVLVGNGKLENELKEKTNNNIHFLPFQNQSQMPAIYRMSNFVVLPSQGPNETWGLVVNEAFACGIPAIVSNKVGCFKDMIIDGKTGYVFESNNKKELLQALLNATENKQDYKTNCLKKSKEFSMENLATAIEQTVINTAN